MTDFKPGDATELACLLRETTAAVEIIGGGSRRTVGHPVEGVRLDVSGLSGIIDYEPRELVLTAHASTPLGEIEPLLA